MKKVRLQCKEDRYAQSINTKVDMVVKGTSFHGMNNYGNIMVGDKGFEYYNGRKVSDYIQIPWEEVDLRDSFCFILKEDIFRGFAIPDETNGTFTFSSKKPKEQHAI